MLKKFLLRLLQPIIEDAVEKAMAKKEDSIQNEINALQEKVKANLEELDRQDVILYKDIHELRREIGLDPDPNADPDPGTDPK